MPDIAQPKLILAECPVCGGGGFSGRGSGYDAVCDHCGGQKYLPITPREAKLAAARPDIRVEPCDYCDSDGWVESAPAPTPNGPHYTYHKCPVCHGTHEVEVALRPIEQEDLPQ